MSERTDSKAETMEVETDHFDVTEYDEGYDRQQIAMLAKAAPNTMFRHPSTFTPDEDKLIAAEIYNRKPLYKIAAILRCSFTLLRKHIDNTPALMEVAYTAREREKMDVEQGLDELVQMRHAGVLMWKAEKLMPEKYGKEVKMEEEDDTRIIIGAIPESDLQEADAILAEAAAKPPEAGLTAMLDERVVKNIDNSLDAQKKDAYDDDATDLNASGGKADQPVQPLAQPMAQNLQMAGSNNGVRQAPPEGSSGMSFGTMSDYVGYGEDDFSGGDWMS